MSSSFAASSVRPRRPFSGAILLAAVLAAQPADAGERSSGAASPGAQAGPATRDDSPAAGGSFAPTPELDLRALERVVRARSAQVQAAALDVDVAAADLRQARLLSNPALDASWNTIPIGETNPKDLASPLAHVPSYGVGLSYTFPLGKRGPRIDRAEALQRGAAAALDVTAREQALSLARVLGSLATSTLRRDSIRGLIDDGNRAVALAEARLAANFGTPLDVERLRIEVSRTEQTLLASESDISTDLAACASLVGARCQGFAGSADARRFLDRWIGREPAQPARLEERADLRALDAYRTAATAEARLAHAQAIPDPTVRVGYVHDTFLASGAQGDSVNLSVTLPLPLFDRGQAQAAAADARTARYAAQRARTLDAARARIPALGRRVEDARRRRESLARDVIPRAVAVLNDVEKAAEGRLLPLTDVIQAQRTVRELLLEEADSYGDAFGASIELAAELPAPATAPNQESPR